MPDLNPKIVVHHFVVKKGVRHVKQAQKQFRLKLVPLNKIEVNKLIEVEFIREVKCLTWISSIVPIQIRISRRMGKSAFASI